MITKSFNIGDSFSFDGKNLNIKTRSSSSVFKSGYNKDYKMYSYDDPDKPYYIPNNFRISLRIYQTWYDKKLSKSINISNTEMFNNGYLDDLQSTIFSSRDNEMKAYNNPEVSWVLAYNQLTPVISQIKYVSIYPKWLSSFYCIGYIDNDDVYMRFNAWFYYV